MAPVELRMDVHCDKCAKKIKKAVENMRGVTSVWASPRRRRVVVYGTANAHALRQRIEEKMQRPVQIVGDGPAPYYYPPAAPHYGPSQLPAYAYYSQPPPQPPAVSYPYPYAAGGYGAGRADRGPYGYGYAAHSTVPTCSIL